MSLGACEMWEVPAVGVGNRTMRSFFDATRCPLLKLPTLCNCSMLFPALRKTENVRLQKSYEHLKRHLHERSHASSVGSRGSHCFRKQNS